MSDTTRTFVAIAIPGVLEPELLRWQSLLATEIPECRWTVALPFHLTLAFLGDVRNNGLHELCETINGVASSLESFEIGVRGIGAFPNAARPRVIWSGISGPSLKCLTDLQEAVVNAISDVGFRPDDTRFHPHVTLGRIKPGQRIQRDLNRLVERYQDWSAGSFTVAEVTTFASTLSPGGPVYAAISHAPLKSR
jgi:2'-5' RNA ligase